MNCEKKQLIDRFYKLWASTDPVGDEHRVVFKKLRELTTDDEFDAIQASAKVSLHTNLIIKYDELHRADVKNKRAIEHTEWLIQRLCGFEEVRRVRRSVQSDLAQFELEL
jgi:hypothetical protein